MHCASLLIQYIGINKYISSALQSTNIYSEKNKIEILYNFWLLLIANHRADNVF